jgi:hypothetical protein
LLCQNKCAYILVIMTIIFEARPSDSPYVETVTHGWTACEGRTIRPAECQWHMVLRRLGGKIDLLAVGPLTASGVVSYGEGAELLWIKFKLGAFMPHWPARRRLDQETTLPGAASRSFWLNGSAWLFPDFENADTFVDRLAREGVLARDPVVDAALHDEPPALPARTLRHRFLRATGLTQSHIRQVERAKRAEALLRQGRSILDTVHEAGYFDQPHLTRALKRWVGYTPAQIIRMSARACRSVQDSAPVPGYDTDVLARIR